jgi:SAM-dependent methyltransferase
MKNKNAWRPSKFVLNHGTLTGSRDTKEVGIGSRLSADLIAAFYDDALPRHATGKLLDLGCGKAPLFGLYKDYVTDAVCIDWKNSEHNSEFLDFECDLTEPLPFNDGEFNTIILSDVLEHVPIPEFLWREMSRVLSAGGKIILNVPFYYWVHEEPYDFYRYTEFALRRFAQNAGLTVVHLEAIGGAPEIITDIFSKCILRLPVAGTWLSICAQRFTWTLLKTGFGRRLSEATRDRFPFAYAMIAVKPK